MAAIRRVHIIGGPGSGKTTLARILSERMRTPPFDLDEIGYEGGAGPSRPLAVKLEDVRRIASQPTWITEGAFLWWTEDLFHAADVIVWLDLPFRIAARRIVLRHLKAELAGRNRHPGWRNLLRFLNGVRRYHRSETPARPRALDDDGAVTRYATAEALTPYVSKVVHCWCPANVASFLASLPEPRRGITL